MANPGKWRSVPDVCRIFCCNVWGLARNLSDLTVVSSQYDILLCFETLVSYLNHLSEFLVPGYQSLCLALPGLDASDPREGCI